MVSPARAPGKAGRLVDTLRQSVERASRFKQQLSAEI